MSETTLSAKLAELGFTTGSFTERMSNALLQLDVLRAVNTEPTAPTRGPEPVSTWSLGALTSLLDAFAEDHPQKRVGEAMQEAARRLRAALSHQAAPGREEPNLVARLREWAAFIEKDTRINGRAVIAGGMRDAALRISLTPLPAPEDAGRREAVHVLAAWQRLNTRLSHAPQCTAGQWRAGRQDESCDCGYRADALAVEAFLRAAAAGETREREAVEAILRARRILAMGMENASGEGADLDTVTRANREAYEQLVFLPGHPLYRHPAAPAREPGASHIAEVPAGPMLTYSHELARPTEPGAGEPIAYTFTLDGVRQVMLVEDCDDDMMAHGTPLYARPTPPSAGGNDGR